MLEGLTAYLILMSGVVNRGVEYTKPAIVWLAVRFDWKEGFKRYVVFVSSAGFAFVLVWSNPLRAPSMLFAGIPILEGVHPIAAATMSALAIAGGANIIHAVVNLFDALINFLERNPVDVTFEETVTIEADSSPSN